MSTAPKKLYFIFGKAEDVSAAKMAWCQHEIKTTGRMQTMLSEESVGNLSQISLTKDDPKTQAAFEEFLDQNFADKFVVSKSPKVDASIEALFRNAAR